MKHLLLLFVCCLSANAVLAQATNPRKLSKIGFGSCAHQDKDQSILYKVTEKKPDLFIYLGDNIYGDTRDMSVLEGKYNTLGAKPEFQQLCEKAEILATWDDHDFGQNDGGKFYCCKEQSKEVFLNFWKEPQDSERRRHAGIYHSVVYGEAPQRVQVILLDTRTFRDNLLENDKKNGHKNDYRPHESPDSTLLGAEQWAWLETQLKQPADLRIVASSNQFSHEYNGWESWTNFPAEQAKMLSLLKTTQANGVVFLSGDVHWGEISKLPVEGAYPIYDVTSSGLTQNWHSTERNKHRLGGITRIDNFGMIEIHWDKQELLLQIYGRQGKKRNERKVALSDLKF